jgi:hypothetical protein
MRVFAVLLLLFPGGYLVGSPAHPVSEAPVTILVEEAVVTGSLLTVSGRLLANEGPEPPRSYSFGEERTTLRLYGVERERVVPGSILTAVHVHHSVRDDERSHLLVDLITPTDRRNAALMRIAIDNPEVPVLDLKAAERLLREHDAAYMTEGYATPAEWELRVRFSRIQPVGELETRRYFVEFYSPTGTVNAEWTLRMDLDAGSIESVAVFEAAPPPEE